MKIPVLLALLLLNYKYAGAADEMSEMMIKPELANSVPAGTELLLTCIYEPELISDVFWFDPEQNLIQNDNSDRTVDGESENGKVFLTLNSITEAANGLYTCQGRMNNETIKVTRVIAVFDPVAIINTPAVQEFLIGQTVEVICQVKGDPAPDIIWSKGSEDKLGVVKGKYYLQPNSTNLMIFNISRDDVGVYNCKARELSKGQTKDRDIEVKILVPPVIVNFSEALTAVEGDSLEVKCEATGEPMPTIKWYRGTGALFPKTLITDGDTLMLANVTKVNNDIHIYTCEATNKAGATESQMELTVYVKPSFTAAEDNTTRDGDEVILQCVASGDPKPTVRFYQYGKLMEETIERDIYAIVNASTNITGAWLEDDATVTYDGSTATILFKYTKIRNAGLYECRASNLAGNASTKIELFVEYGPQDVNLKSQYTCSGAGSRVTLECQFDANPVPTLSWGYNLMDEGSNGFVNETTYFIPYNVSDLPPNVEIEQFNDMLLLTITADNADAFKAYLCRAENDIDSNFATAYINLADAPTKPIDVSISNIETRQATVNFSEPLIPYTSIDYYTIVWTPADPNIQTGKVNTSFNEYTLTDLEHNTEYVITVEATNCAGMGPPSDTKKFTTKAITLPERLDIMSGKASEDHSKYTVKWKVNGRGGGEISKIMITVKKVVDDIDSTNVTDTGIGNIIVKPDDEEFQNNSYTVTDLDPSSQYEIILSVFNEAGSIDTSARFSTANKSLFIIDPTTSNVGVETKNILKLPQPKNEPEATTPDEGDKKDLSAGSTNGLIIGIIILIFILILIVIDCVCCFTRHCGVSMFIYSHTCAKCVKTKKQKVEDVEEGSAEFRQGTEGKYRNISKLTPISEQTPLKSDEPNETPAIAKAYENEEAANAQAPEETETNVEKKKENETKESDKLVENAKSQEEVKA